MTANGSSADRKLAKTQSMAFEDDDRSTTEGRLDGRQAGEDQVDLVRRALRRLPRKRMTEGEVDSCSDNNVPKSVSAETITRDSSAARSKMASSLGGLHTVVEDVNGAVTCGAEPHRDARREGIVDEEVHASSGIMRSRTASAA